MQQLDETINNTTPHETSPHISPGSVPPSNISRMFLAVLGLLILVGFGLARSVDPDPSGRGTHRQFGLPPCVILTQTSIPCPTCGMTTSFAHFVRGEWRESSVANTSGFLLALLSLCFLPWSIATIVFKKWWLVREPEPWVTGISLGWMVVLILEWGCRNFLS